MILNAVEKILMNNPVRSFIQWKKEAAMFEKLGGKWLDRRFWKSAAAVASVRKTTIPKRTDEKKSCDWCYVLSKTRTCILILARSGRILER